MRKVIAVILAVALGVIARPCFAWGRDGHGIVGVIAWQYMTDKAKASVGVLLGGQSLADAGNWADEIQKDAKYNWSKPLHYINVPRDAKKIDMTRDCAKGECVVAAIDRFSRIVRDTKASKQERADALRFLIHFVEDIHQPLHVSYADDRGGNETKVTWLGKATNLHAVYDTSFIETRIGNKNRLEYAQKLGQMCQSQFEKIKSTRSDPGAWANESLTLTRQIYSELPENGLLDQVYFDSNIGMVEDRLQLAGMRLAILLNEVLANVDQNTQPADFISITESDESCGDVGGYNLYIGNNHPFAEMRVKVRRTIAGDDTKTQTTFTYDLKAGERKHVGCSKVRIHTGGEAICSFTVLVVNMKG